MRTPVFTVNCLVSRIIPASIIFASRCILSPAGSTCSSISATSSHAAEAEGSIYAIFGSRSNSAVFLWWSIITVSVQLLASSGDSKSATLFTSTIIRRVCVVTRSSALALSTNTPRYSGSEANSSLHSSRLGSPKSVTIFTGTSANIASRHTPTHAPNASKSANL